MDVTLGHLTSQVWWLQYFVIQGAGGAGGGGAAANNMCRWLVLYLVHLSSSVLFSGSGITYGGAYA
jgi:hypothetical protein